MFKKIFNKKHYKEILSPMTGSIIPLEEVPDPAFSEKMLGNGCAIILNSGEILSPIDGKITVAFKTGHAFGIVDEDGDEILIHIGIDTVEMEGDGFNPMVEVGDFVKKGDILCKVDIGKILEHKKSLISPILVLDKDDIIVVLKNKSVIAGKDIIMNY